MQALVLHELKSPLKLEQRPQFEPGPRQVVVQLKAAALNRRDYWITQGMYPGIKLPVVLGSDGAGVIARVGENAPHGWIGREVVINPGLDWGEDEAAQGESFRILGMPDDGAFAEEVLVGEEAIHDKPEHLTWQEAAALPLGGMTAYRAVFTQGEVKPGETVLVTGVGGGVATFALQFAVAAGARVLATSSSPEKLAKAEQLGAAAGYNYTQEGWAKQLVADHGAVHLIIDSAGGDGYRHLLDIAAPGGRIVNYGATAGPPPKLDLFKVFWKQLRLIGSTMGSPTDFRAMLGLVHHHKIRPAIDRVFPLAEANDALARMRESSQFGKLVLDIA
ncbi:MAG: zinc-binding dehydrogenase [Pirellulaceae bacterium]